MARLWRRRGSLFSTGVSAFPTRLDGRFTLLSLHLFAMLHRLKQEGAEGRALAQELIDPFTQNMETVLRELAERYQRPEATAKRPLTDAIGAALPG